jgi:hypothetical protein
MNFIEAVKLLKLDKNIKLKRRSKEVTVTLHPLGNHFMIEDIYSFYLTTVDDILAEDWYLVKDEKLHSFEDALKAYKSGKNIRRKGYHYTVYYDFDCEFDRDDVMANDWIIEETK